MAYQFTGMPVYSVGIECNALKSADIYHCIIGKEKKELTISYEQALGLVGKYGEDKVIRKIKGKNVFIVPINEFI